MSQLHVNPMTRLQQPGQQAPHETDENRTQDRAAKPCHVHTVHEAGHQGKHRAVHDKGKETQSEDREGQRQEEQDRTDRDIRQAEQKRRHDRRPHRP